MNWTCACGAVNLARQKECEACGEKRLRQAAFPPKGAQDERCHWVSAAGLRCLMFAEMGAFNRPKFCGWHDECRTYPAWAEDFAEFERWVAAKRARNYCAAWTHRDPRRLWEALAGRDPDLGARRPCEQGGCPNRVLEEVR